MGRQPVCICIHRVWNYYLGVVNGTQQCPRAREAEAESRAAGCAAGCEAVAGARPRDPWPASLPCANPLPLAGLLVTAASSEGLASALHPRRASASSTAGDLQARPPSASLCLSNLLPPLPLPPPPTTSCAPSPACLARRRAPTRTHALSSTCCQLAAAAGRAFPPNNTPAVRRPTSSASPASSPSTHTTHHPYHHRITARARACPARTLPVPASRRLTLTSTPLARLACKQTTARSRRPPARLSPAVAAPPHRDYVLRSHPPQLQTHAPTCPRTGRRPFRA